MEDRLTLQYIKNYFKQDISLHSYKLPRILVEAVKEATIKDIQLLNKEDKRCIRRLENALECNLYLVLAIIYFNKDKKDVLTDKSFIIDGTTYRIHYKYDAYLGCQLSKEILSNVLSTSLLYQSKKILLDNHILEKVPLKKDGKDIIYYSKNYNRAIKYVINKKYLIYSDLVEIQNKYADKHAFLLKEDVLFGNKRKTLIEDFEPFDTQEKNKQYHLQKKLIFDVDEFKKIFLEKYNELSCIPGLWERLDKTIEMGCYKSKTFTADVIKNYKLLYLVNNHVFKATESFGRIFMPFHYMSKEFRLGLRFEGHKLKELFDMKCCFVQLAARLFLKQTTYKEEAKQLIDIALKDIYKDIAEKEKITRKSAKNYMMQFLFATPFDRRINEEKIHLALVTYFKTYYPNFYNWLMGYKVVIKRKGKKLKHISTLSQDCFMFESNLMFKTVLPYLEKKYPDIVFLSLHDGIWTTDNNRINIKEEVMNLINSFNE